MSHLALSCVCVELLRCDQCLQYIHSGGGLTHALVNIGSCKDNSVTDDTLYVAWASGSWCLTLEEPYDH